jgi:hypothetical protein
MRTDLSKSETTDENEEIDRMLLSSEERVLERIREREGVSRMCQSVRERMRVRGSRANERVSVGVV